MARKGVAAPQTALRRIYEAVTAALTDVQAMLPAVWIAVAENATGWEKQIQQRG